MHNITLVCTVHNEAGKCNPDELHKIIESINPDVIFDELPSHFSDMYYSDSFDMYCANMTLQNRPPPQVPLEVKCNKKYKQNHKVEIFPVDIDVRHTLSKYQDEIFFMFNAFYENEDYANLNNEKETLISQRGFNFLNSDEFLDLLEKKETIEKSIIESGIHKNRLLYIYKLFHAEQYDNRENAMFQNIINYSKRNQYNQAVFLIGAEHKKSIMQKIEEYERNEKFKLHWAFYNN